MGGSSSESDEDEVVEGDAGGDVALAAGVAGQGRIGAEASASRPGRRPPVPSR